jgi:hypothetical protein
MTEVWLASQTSRFSGHLTQGFLRFRVQNLYIYLDLSS